MSIDLYQPQRSWLEVMVPAAELAKQIAGTEFVPKSLRNNPATIAACILYGDELGIGPLQSLAKIHVIEGRPALSAEAQRALILQAGHDIWIEDATNTKVTVCGKRKDSEQVNRFTWTLDDAKRANLAGRPSWRMYPRQMLTARATAELARAVFADAIGGLMAIEELEELGDPAVSPSNGAEGETRRTRRRSKTALAPSASSGLNPTERTVHWDKHGQMQEGPVLAGPPLPGEVADETGASGGLSAALPDVEQEPQFPIPDEIERKPTERQLKNLNRLVGTLREKGYISTENLWAAVANSRGVDFDEMIELLDGRYPDEEVLPGHEGDKVSGFNSPRLHWSPLRESLSRDEAANLTDRLQRLEETVGGGE